MGAGGAGSDDARRAVEVTVTGQVQGVGFRYHTQSTAERLGVGGWVRNETDGSVSVHAEGRADAVDALVAWLRAGPPSASVSGVDVRDADDDGGTRFQVR